MGNGTKDQCIPDATGHPGEVISVDSLPAGLRHADPLRTCAEARRLSELIHIAIGEGVPAANIHVHIEV